MSKVFAITSDYFDTSWVIKAASEEDARAKLLIHIIKIWDAEAFVLASENGFYVKDLFEKRDIITVEGF